MLHKKSIMRQILSYLVVVVLHLAASAADKPNIVLIIADDELVRGRIRFTQGYVLASVNRPLSGSKANHMEGGIRIPFLRRWPEKIPGNSEYEYPVTSGRSGSFAPYTGAEKGASPPEAFMEKRKPGCIILQRT
jgi:hypothetical protein